MERSLYSLFIWLLFFLVSAWLWYHGGLINDIFTNITHVTLLVMLIASGLGFIYYLYQYLIKHKHKDKTKEPYGEKIDSASFDYQMCGNWGIHM